MYLFTDAPTRPVAGHGPAQQEMQEHRKPRKIFLGFLPSGLPAERHSVDTTNSHFEIHATDHIMRPARSELLDRGERPRKPLLARAADDHVAPSSRDELPDATSE